MQSGVPHSQGKNTFIDRSANVSVAALYALAADQELFAG
jgi:hypothetical protein